MNCRLQTSYVYVGGMQGPGRTLEMTRWQHIGLQDSPTNKLFRLKDVDLLRGKLSNMTRIVPTLETPNLILRAG